MTPLTIGFKLWARGVCLNAVAMGIIAIPEFNIFAVAVFIGALLLGFIIGSPLIIVVSWLVKVFVELPYDAIDKFVWLLFALALTAAGFYAMLASLLSLPKDIVAAATCGTVFAVVMAAFWSKSSLLQLNNASYEYQPR